MKRSAIQCYRCKAFDHNVMECPFPAPNQMAEIKKTSSSASSSAAGVHMSARHAEGPNHSSGVLVTKVKPILNYDMLANGLSSHPDQTFVSRINLLTYCKDGVPIGYQGPRSFRDCSNWPSVSKYKTSN